MAAHNNKVLLATLAVTAIACLLVMAEAQTTNIPRGRSLLQNGLTCSAAKALSGQCNNLCDCVAKSPEYKNSGRQLSECTGPCESCVSATQNCPKDDKLPGACSSYANDPAVQKCIGGSGRRLF